MLCSERVSVQPIYHPPTPLARLSSRAQSDTRRLLDIPGLQAAAAAVKASLEEKIVEYTRRRDRLRLQVAPLAFDVEKRKGALAKDAHALALEAAETKLKNQEQSTFALKECASAGGGSKGAC